TAYGLRILASHVGIGDVRIRDNCGGAVQGNPSFESGARMAMHVDAVENEIVRNLRCISVFAAESNEAVMIGHVFRGGDFNANHAIKAGTRCSGESGLIIWG